MGEAGFEPGARAAGRRVHAGKDGLSGKQPPGGLCERLRRAGAQADRSDSGAGELFLRPRGGRAVQAPARRIRLSRPPRHERRARRGGGTVRRVRQQLRRGGGAAGVSELAGAADGQPAGIVSAGAVRLSDGGRPAERCAENPDRRRRHRLPPLPRRRERL